MSPKIKKSLIAILSILIIFVLLVGTLSYVSIRQSFPLTEGSVSTSAIEDSALISVNGVDQPVHIYRDSRGIPHIYAATLHDLFYAQGYVHAQDRFW